MGAERKAGLLYTREPGSWVMFSVAYLTGAVKAGPPGLPSLVVFLSLGLLLAAKAPAARLIRGAERAALSSALVFSVPAAGGIAYSCLREPELIFLYLAGGALMVVYFLAGKKNLLLQEAAGMAVMGLTAAMAGTASTGGFSHLYLWPLFFAFYLASSFRVRTGSRKYRLASAGYSGALAAAGVVAFLAGSPALLPFVVLSEDIYSAFRGKREPFKRLGFIESAKAVVFAALVMALSP